jgi:predicted RNase H-like nuclease (RuvC/YqgF family)
LSAIKQKSVGEKKVRETQKLVDKLSNDVKEAETQVNTLKKTLDETTDPE